MLVLAVVVFDTVETSRFVISRDFLVNGKTLVGVMFVMVIGVPTARPSCQFTSRPRCLWTHQSKCLKYLIS
jgi:hypothetical protein